MSNAGVWRTLVLPAFCSGVLMSLTLPSIAGVAVETAAGICDTRFVNLVPDAAKIADTRYPIWQDTNIGSCDSGPVGLLIIVR